MWLLLSREIIGLGNYQLHYEQHNHQGVQNPRGSLTASRDSNLTVGPITASQVSARTAWDVRVTCEGGGMVVPH